VRTLVLALSLASLFSAARREARRGEQRYRRGDFAEAGRAFASAAAREPAEKTWRLDLGTAAAAAGDSTAARKAFEEAAGSRDPRLSSTALYQLGTLALRENKPVDAVAPLRRCLEIDPSARDAKRNLEIALARSAPPPPPPSSGKEESATQPPPRSSRAEEREFERKAGMTRQEAESLLRSLEAEQRRHERPRESAAENDW
jgi:tetratricopeptide (TPR) repeat protein